MVAHFPFLHFVHHAYVKQPASWRSSISKIRASSSYFDGILLDPWFCYSLRLFARYGTTRTQPWGASLQVNRRDEPRSCGGSYIFTCSAVIRVGMDRASAGTSSLWNLFCSVPPPHSLAQTQTQHKTSDRKNIYVCMHAIPQKNRAGQYLT